MFFCAQPVPVADTIAAVANTTRRLGRMMVGVETQEAENVNERLYLTQEDPLKATG
jgi:hypothetical protein